MLLPAVFFLVNMPTALADSHTQTEPAAAVSADGNIVSYSPAYFSRYQPLTALDMVRQVPGFHLEENDESIRGMGEALGNLLINDRRPSAKQDQPVQILARIPAELVQRIELIRGPVRDIDMQGQATLVNIVMLEEADAVVQWDGYLRQTFRHGEVTPKLSISISHQWQGIDYIVGMGWRRSRVGDNGKEEIFDSTGTLDELRILNQENRNTFMPGSLTASRWFGNTLVRFNTNFLQEEHLFVRRSRRIPRDEGSSRLLIIERDAEEPKYEAGLDLERDFGEGLTGKLIFLFFRGYEDVTNTQQTLSASGNRSLLRIADFLNITTEGISRVELNWTVIPDHTVQANIEGVYNLLDGKFSQTDDSGTGPISVDVPGANSRVEELRGNFVIKDVWSLGALELDYGIGAEVSRLTQTGDFENEQSFFFIKPQAILTWTPEQGKQTRLRIAREVSQLNLGDFISATVFEDNDLALGNPEIRPDTTWKAELSYERRFGGDTSVKVLLFHHWISDVLDLLPLSADFEAPGNIGDGRRWGVELESTLPLGWAGLAGARINLKGRWQDSTVVDPVTGEDRVLSAIRRLGPNNYFNIENEYAFSVDFRQDFEGLRMAWGVILQERAERLRFRVNELLIEDDEPELNAFIETTRWLGIKIRVDYENITDFAELRDRTFYTGKRGLSPVSSREFRDQAGGPRVFLTFSGTF